MPLSSAPSRPNRPAWSSCARTLVGCACWICWWATRCRAFADCSASYRDSSFHELNMGFAIYRWQSPCSIHGKIVSGSRLGNGQEEKKDVFMRADRLLSILLLLQINRRLTARELAKRLEVSERTILRDMEALSTAGVPVTAERGIGGGWYLLEEYRTNLTGMSEAEIRTLFLMQPTRLLADLGWHQASEAALIKLLAALPSLSRRNAEDMRQRIHVDTASWHRPEEAFPYLQTLQDAIWQERKLHMLYQRSDDSTVERLVDPLGLVAKG